MAERFAAPFVVVLCELESKKRIAPRSETRYNGGSQHSGERGSTWLWTIRRIKSAGKRWLLATAEEGVVPLVERPGDLEAALERMVWDDDERSRWTERARAWSPAGGGCAGAADLVVRLLEGGG